MSLPPFAAPLVVRPLHPGDVEALLHIQTVCYGDGFQESREVFTQRLSSPLHCSLGVVLEDDAHGSTLQAYLAAYWSTLGKITPLNGVFESGGPGIPVLYLHDMSVLPALAGQGVARHLTLQLLTQARARGLAHAALVSVQGSRSYWERQGFSVTSVNDAQQYKHLQTYGEGASYMTMKL